MFRLGGLLALALILTAGLSGKAEPPTLPSRIFKQSIVLDTLGNASVRLQWLLPVNEFNVLRWRVSATTQNVKDGKTTRTYAGTPQGLEQYLNLHNLDVSTRDVKVTLDERASTITATFKIDGWSRTTSKSQWAVEVLDNARWYQPLADYIPPVAASIAFETRSAAQGMVAFGGSGVIGGVRTAVLTEVKLPSGATQGKLLKRDNGRWAVFYRQTKTAGAGSEDGEVELRIEPRREVLPALHKLYGDPTWPTWYLARTNLSNTTKELVKNVRVRARVSTSAGQTSWSDWEEVASVVHPGQTAQFPLRPVLESKALMLISQENGKLSVEMELTRGRTKVVKRRTARLNVLGRNDVVYSLLATQSMRYPTYYHQFQESPMVLTAFVTPNDTVVKDLKGQICSLIGGLPTTNDQGARKFAKALYNYFRTNISYSSPVGSETEEGKMTQHVNYPRNVLKSGTGTCIDLSVTFASVCEAAGIKSGVCVIPGHAFPFIVLPSGQRLYIESTFCGAGTLKGSKPFAIALEQGNINVARNLLLIEARIDVTRPLLSAPELPRIDSANPLKDWGRKTPPAIPEAGIGLIKVEHNVKSANGPAVQFVFDVVIEGGKDHPCEVEVKLRDAAGKVFTNSAGQAISCVVALTPGANKWRQQVRMNYSYATIGAAEDGKWREMGVEVDIHSAAARESTMLQPVKSQLLLKRLAAESKGDHRVQSLLCNVTVGKKAGKIGLDLFVENVHFGTEAGEKVRTVVNPVGGASLAVLKKPDGKGIRMEADQAAATHLFLPADELGKENARQLKGLRINFWDAKNKRWALGMDSPVISVK